MLSLRSIWREADNNLAGPVAVFGRSFETEVPQDDASRRKRCSGILREAFRKS